jgi:ribonuclease R
MKKHKHYKRTEIAILSLLAQHRKTGLEFKEILHNLPDDRFTRRALRGYLLTMTQKQYLILRGTRYLLSPNRGKEKLREEENVFEGVLETDRRNNLIFTREGFEKPAKIYPEHSSGALAGDKVRIRMIQRRSGGKIVGKVLRILNRKGLDFLFKIERRRIITRTDFLLPIRVENYSKLKENRWYRGRITTEISPNFYPAKLIEEVSIQADLDIEDLISRFSITCTFPDNVLRAKLPEPDLLNLRVDLTQLSSFTIDGADAKDFDDAISIRKQGEQYQLFVHIADVSAYVRSGDPVDKEARGRGTSIYFPTQVIPMLPEVLSEDLCSLKPGVDRYTLTCEMLFSGSGGLKKAWCYPSKIHSRRRFTYEEVESVLEGKSQSSLSKELRLARDLHRQIRNRRIDAGSIDFDLPEPIILLDEKHHVLDIQPKKRLESHLLIEDFMLAANETIACFSQAARLPTLYRHHPQPKKERREELRQILNSVGLSFPKKDSLGPKAYQELVSRIAPEMRSFLQPLVLRSMAKAIYHEEKSEHFGLAMKNYCHFTSPIRRYPDLIVHRQLKELFEAWSTEFPYQIFPFSQSAKQGPPTGLSLPRLKTLGHLMSLFEKRAVQVEREYNHRKKAQFMQKKLGQVFDARISGMLATGLFAEIENYAVEGFLSADSLPGYWLIDPKFQRARSTGSNGITLKLGDPLKVRINDVDESTSQVTFSYVEPKKARAD